MAKTKTENAAILHDAQMKRLMEVREVLAYVASQVVDDFQGMGWEVLERGRGGDGDVRGFRHGPVDRGRAIRYPERPQGRP